MAIRTGAITADELYRMPNDGVRRELVRGELRMMAPAGNEHGRITARIMWRLAQFVETHDLGVVFAAETGFRIGVDPDTVRAPDVAFVSHARRIAVGDHDGYWPGAPDLVIEVMSPNDRRQEVEQKSLDWLEAGTRLAIVVDPRKHTLAVYRSAHEVQILQGNDLLSCEEIVPGWQVSVREIFA